MWQSCLCVLSFIVGVEAGHFDGGSIRWSPMDTSGTTSPIQIAISQSYSYTLSTLSCTVGAILGSTGIGFNYSLLCTLNCGTSTGYVPPRVLGYCTGSNAALDVAFSQRTDVVNLTAGDYFSVSFGILNTLGSGFYRSLTLSNGTITGSAHWNITAAIDVRVRADNGRINTPPVANLMSPRGIPLNTPTQIIIPTLDIDNDNVRCRWGNSSLECGGVCFPAAIPPSTSLSSNCVINITGTSLTAWYAGSLQVEDFSTSSSSTPLSSIPVQFLFYVYAPKNCSIPTLTSSATCFDVQVGLSYTITLTATNNCGASSNISDIVVQSFAGVVQGSLVSVNPPYVYTRSITFTPSMTQLGPQMLCTIALDNTNVPSNQYCVIFIVSSTAISSCSVNSNTTAQSISSTTRTPTSTSIDWALIATVACLVPLFCLLVCLSCCYYFVWSAKARTRRRQRQRTKKQFEYENCDSQLTTSTPPSAATPKSYQVHDIEPEESHIPMENNEEHSAKRLPMDKNHIQEPTRPASSSSSASDEVSLGISVRWARGNAVNPQVSNTDSADSTNDKSNEKEEAKVETKKKHPVRRRKKLVVVHPMLGAKALTTTAESDQRRKPTTSSVHVTRVVN